MKTWPANRGLCAISVFKRQYPFSNVAVNLLNQFGIEYMPVCSVYEAVSLLARDDGVKKLIMLGTVKELGREKGRFFEICRDNGNAQCICYRSEGCRSDNRVLNKAIHCGALVVGSASELEEVLRSLTENEGLRPETKQPGQNKRKNIEQEIQITAEELEALLGDD